MSSLFGGSKYRRTPSSGLESVPAGAQMLSMESKKAYEPNPVHLYHPNPYNAITVLRGKKDPHDWLVCGWYLDTFREQGGVKGLIYRCVASEEDKQFVLAELKKMDKDANIRFSFSA